MSQAPDTPAARLAHTVEHLAHLLPAQGPIGVFIHHNTLHAFQHLPFDEAVRAGAETFGAQPYMREAAFREAFAAGRIRRADVVSVIAAEGRDVDVRTVMLDPGVRSFSPATVRWAVYQGGVRSTLRTDLTPDARKALEGQRPEAIFDFWLANTPVRTPAAHPARRPTEGIRATTGTDLDEAVHPPLIRLSSAFLDQGLAYWPMPNRERGFWWACVDLLAQGGTVDPRALRDLRAWATRWKPLDAASAVLAAFETLGVDEPEWEALIQAELLALPGWAGLMHQLEHDPALAPHEVVPASLMDFLAVRLLLTVSAVSGAGALRSWKTGIVPAPDAVGAQLVEAATLFDVSQLLGLGTRELARWDTARIDAFRAAVLACDDWERRRLWQAAYERRHERQVLLPLREHGAATPMPVPERVAAQVFFCIDEREESVRRHLEEVDPEIETLSAAGFFGVAMNFTGLDDAHGVALCPVVVKPQHAVIERPVGGHERAAERRQVLRRAWASLTRHTFISSRTLVRGWIGTTVLGIFSMVPITGRVLSPRLWGRFTTWLNDSVLPNAQTELTVQRHDALDHAAPEGLMRGFAAEEKIERVASVLGPAGLRKGMARLVVILGHGSTSLNNPHESAHDCGACGGRRGGPNARIFALMANRPHVREGLRKRGIFVSEDTWFVGGYHDTSSDQIDLYDLEQVPASHAQDLARVQRALDEARARSAHERARRFEYGPSSPSAAAGLRHVQARAEHLAEPRPEYGHCTNAVCIVGRRATTRGLFLDRRAFLVSYDATQDPDDDSLGRLLAAAIPVCGGISLEYYFSFVDNERYGCGTKLPHNVTGLVGVMNGNEGDLRTGLPWQMVEIHEPVRILFVIESTPARVQATIHQNPLLKEFLENRWIRLATINPDDPTDIQMYRWDGAWEAVTGDDERLASAPSSLAWYRGHQEHLGIARIGPRAPATVSLKAAS